MTGKQTAVLWSGLILIIVRLFTTGQWSALWSTVSATTPQDKVGLAGKILLQDPLLFPPSTPGGGGGGGGAHPIST